MYNTYANHNKYLTANILSKKSICVYCCDWSQNSCRTYGFFTGDIFMSSKDTIINVNLFYKKVNKNGPYHKELKSNCWIYQGMNYVKNRPAYRYFIGEIPKGMCVLHKCDNPKCVNS